MGWAGGVTRPFLHLGDELCSRFLYAKCPLYFLLSLPAPIRKEMDHNFTAPGRGAPKPFEAVRGQAIFDALAEVLKQRACLLQVSSDLLGYAIMLWLFFLVLQLWFSHWGPRGCNFSLFFGGNHVLFQALIKAITVKGGLRQSN